MSPSTLEPSVSVVIPFYNTAEFLAEAIESVISQKFSDFELILLDNCSTDGSTEIAKEFTARDSRVLFFQNREFLTQVQNYNEALLHISPRSKYTKVVQADDLIYPHCLTEMVAFAEENPSVGVVASYRLVGTEIMPARLPQLGTVMSGPEAARLELLQGLSLFGTPTSLLLRSDIVRQRESFYTEGMLFEDTAVVYEILRDHDYGFVHDVLSFTRLDEQSIYGSWRSFYPMALAHLIELERYGPEFLSEAELHEALRTQRKAYNQVLAKEWLRRREEDFWEFHRRGLAEIGERITFPTLIWPAVAVIFRNLLAPKRVARALASRLGYGHDERSARCRTDPEASGTRGQKNT
jgi:glycosyltransferase involved in cell wall biosynthesis